MAPLDTPGLTITTNVTSRLSWDYTARVSPLNSLYESAKDAQWNASTDVVWSLAVPFGEPLPDDSPFAMASFAASPLGPRGRQMWDTFRWELQSWLVSQFLHGEQGALVAAARLIEVVPGLDGKLCAASQAVDEARHVEVFSRYLREKIPEPYCVSVPLASLMDDVLADSRWDITALGMQIMVEALAMAAFRLANNTFHDELIRNITKLVARDEARHVAFGMHSLEGAYRQMSAAERADREDMVLEAAYLMRRRFLLEQIWERIDVDVDEGMAYAIQDPLMIRYRQAIFSQVLRALARIGLMTQKVREGFQALDLIGYSAERIFRSGSGSSTESNAESRYRSLS